MGCSQKHSGFVQTILAVISAFGGIWSIIEPTAIVNDIYMRRYFVIANVVVLVIIEKLHLKKLFNEDGSRKK